MYILKLLFGIFVPFHRLLQNNIEDVYPTDSTFENDYLRSADDEYYPLQRCGYSPFEPSIEDESGKLMIINGQPVKDIRQFPWMVSMEFHLFPIPFFPRSYECTGTIISRRHILTAGHCVGLYLFLRGHGYKNWPKHQTDDFIITAGVANREDSQKDGEQKIHSKWLIPHPKAAFAIDWSPGPDASTPITFVATDDIAIIELSQPLNFTSKVRPICLSANDQPVFNLSGIVAGWGPTNRSDLDLKLNPQLHIGQMRIEQDACKNYSLFEQEKQLCIISEKRTTIALCHGDSGGSMMVKIKKGQQGEDLTDYFWTQTGINSMINGKEPCYAPDIVTRVAYYCDWIRNATGNMATCI